MIMEIQVILTPTLILFKSKWKINTKRRNSVEKKRKQKLVDKTDKIITVPCFEPVALCIPVPGALLPNFNDGGFRQRFIFYTQKNHNFRICLPKKITAFLAYLKNPLVLFSQPKKSLFFSWPKKILAFFIDLKKSLLAKISYPKKLLRPPPPPPPSLKYVSGAPRIPVLCKQLDPVPFICFYSKF